MNILLNIPDNIYFCWIFNVVQHGEKKIVLATLRCGLRYGALLWSTGASGHKVKAPIAGQSHEFFSKLEIYGLLIAILVYRIQTSKFTL